MLLTKLSSYISKINYVSQLTLYRRLNTKNCFCHSKMTVPTTVLTFNGNMQIKRTFFKWFKRPSQSQLKIIDNLPDNYNLIYRNTMERYFFWAQLIMLTTVSVVGFVLITSTDESDPHFRYEGWSYQPKPIANEDFVYITVFIGLIIVLQLTLLKLPFRIYNLPQQQKYVFIFYGNLPFSIKRVTCKVAEIAKLEEPDFSIFPWSNSRYITKDNKKIIMFEHFFRRPADLNILLGYQKDDQYDENYQQKP